MPHIQTNHSQRDRKLTSCRSVIFSSSPLYSLSGCPFLRLSNRQKKCKQQNHQTVHDDGKNDKSKWKFVGSVGQVEIWREAKSTRIFK